MSFTQKIFIVSIFLSSNLVVLAQQKNIPLNWKYNQDLNRFFFRQEKSIHTSFKPLIESNIKSTGVEECVIEDTNKYYYQFTQKLFKESLIIIEDEKNEFHFTIDPLFNFEYGIDFFDTTGRKLYVNTRGFLVQGDIGTKFSFASSFYENQAMLPLYLDDHVRSAGEYYPTNAGGYRQQNGVIPGQGRTKPFKGQGYDYAMASGYISYSPIPELNLQFGNGKHFIGNGYRSMLLSDNTFVYPYIKATTSLIKDRIQFTNLYTFLSGLYRLPNHTTPEATFEKKMGTFHFLNFRLTDKFQLGLFESVIWKRHDSTGTQPFNVNFVNPIIYSNTLINGMDGKNNAVVGLNLDWTLYNWGHLYGQFVLDDFKIKRYGYQAGVELFDLFKINLLNVLMEYNNAESYTYSHSIPLQNYSHYNQPLAHPAASGFEEYIGIVNYQIKRVMIKAKLNHLSYDEDFGVDHYGHDIFKSIDNRTMTGVIPERTKVNMQELELAYKFNIKTNAKFLLGFTNREEHNSSYKKNTSYLFIGFRTNLTNAYYDF